eukprot:GHVU01215115.1.p3 GENE.GHVU01215115.1~~GHVU01215115.1.p3  ORF type:complete len:105 (-),score=8.70 GHVU01215115.1:447-761(-)
MVVMRTRAYARMHAYVLTYVLGFPQEQRCLCPGCQARGGGFAEGAPAREEFRGDQRADEEREDFGVEGGAHVEHLVSRPQQLVALRSHSNGRRQRSATTVVVAH